MFPFDRVWNTIIDNWATLTKHPGLALALVFLGLVVGWMAAWLHFRERLNVRKDHVELNKDQIEYLKEKIATTIEQKNTFVIPGPLPMPSKRIANQTFISQTVALDDCEYIDCIFENVTFFYEGRTQIALRKFKIAPGSTFAISSTNAAIINYVGLVEYLSSISGFDVKGLTRTPRDAIPSRKE